MVRRESQQSFYDRRIWSSRASVPAILVAGLVSGLCFEAANQIDRNGSVSLNQILLGRLGVIAAVQAIGWAVLLPFIGRAKMLAAIFLGAIWQPLTCVMSFILLYGLAYIFDQWEIFMSSGALVGFCSKILVKVPATRSVQNE